MPNFNFKRTIIALLILSCLVFTTACSLFSDDGTGYTFKLSLSANPLTLDPQLASDYNSISVARNMFVGLLKYDSNGNLVKGMAKDYSVSPDALVYTFTIDTEYQWRAIDDLTTEKKNDAFYRNVTAYDFVFAFKRLFDKNTDSPYAKYYFAMENSEKVYSGELSPDNLGIRAIDDETLEIKLSYANAEFLHLLTLLPASPCNEEYFNSTKGKYGLEANCTAANGPFYPRDWQHDKYAGDNYLRLRRNDGYSSVSYVSPYGVTYLINTNNDVKLNNFTSETTDILLSNEVLKADFDEYIAEKYYTSSCGLIFNPQNSILSRTDVKEALSMSINREVLKQNVPEYLMPASGIVPTNAFVGGSNYRQSVVEPTIEYNPQMAEYRWNFILSDSEKNSMQCCNIMVESSFADYKYLSNLTDMWRDQLGVYIGVDVVNSADYQRRLQNGDYDICLVQLKSNSSSAVDYITGIGILTETVNTVKNSCGKYNTLTEAFYNISAAEADLIENYHYIPLWYLPEYCMFSEDCQDLIYDIHTKIVIFENAKHF